MPANFNLFPRFKVLEEWQRQTVAAFEVEAITTPGGLTSNKVLAAARPGLESIGYTVEAETRIRVPVLFGINGKVEKSFEADAYHYELDVVLEVEAGRTVNNNAFLKDLFEACAMQTAQHLVIAVCNQYEPPSAKGNPQQTFQIVSGWMDTLFSSGRLEFPLQSIMIIGYG